MIGMIIGTIAITLVIVGIGIALDRRFGVLPADLAKTPASHRAGEAPATALRVGTGQLAKLRASQLCATCRRPMAAHADDTVRFDDRELLVLHFACTCGAARSLYVDVRGVT